MVQANEFPRRLPDVREHLKVLPGATTTHLSLYTGEPVEHNRTVPSWDIIDARAQANIG